MTLEEAQDVFRESYSKHVSAYTDVTPNFDWWFRSGPYAGAEDLERRFKIGLDQVAKYLTWYETHPQEVIWIAPDGTPGIELGFDIDLDGVLLRGFIDAVIQTDPGMAGDNDDGSPRPTVLVRDNKTGNQPGDDFQLAVYGVALAEQYSLEVSEGDYWMGRSGKPTYPFDLTEWTREKVSAKFHELEDNIRAGRFEPKPDPKICNFCDVSYACKYRAS